MMPSELLSWQMNLTGVTTNTYVPAADPKLKEYDVYQSRKIFKFAEKPSSFTVLVSAANGYKLFVNGKQVS